jgi:hypothetical protein
VDPKNAVDIDQEALKQFYREFLSFDLEKKFEMQKHLSSINSIQEYQGLLFEKFRNQDVNLRYKDKRLEFWMLTQEETLNYIKYTVSKPDIVNELASIISSIVAQSSRHHPPIPETRQRGFCLVDPKVVHLPRSTGR